MILLGADGDLAVWRAAVEALGTAVPLEVRRLPAGVDVAPYPADGVVLVRPDGVIAHRLADTAPIGLASLVSVLPAPVA